MTMPVAIVALVIALLVAVGLLFSTVVFCYLWCNTRKEIQVLKRKVEYESVVGKRPNSSVAVQLEDIPKKPTAVPLSNREPPPVLHNSESPPNSNQSSPKDKTTSGYSAVNSLALITEEVRTPEYLQGRELSSDLAKVENGCVREGKQCEVSQGSPQPVCSSVESPPSKAEVKSSSPKARLSSTFYNVPVRTVPGYEDIDPPLSHDPSSKSHDLPTGPCDPSKSHGGMSTGSHDPSKARDLPNGSRDPGGYEHIDPPITVTVDKDDVYNNPADALPSHFIKSQNRVDITTGTVVKEFSDPCTRGGEGKRFQLSTSADVYTDVFDNLPVGDAYKVGGFPQVRSMSDSSPSPTRGVKTNQDGVSHAKPLVNGSNSLENASGIGTRADGTRQSKRSSAKEFVEMDPDKQKFRCTSLKRQKKRDNQRSPDMIDGPLTNGHSDSNGIETSGNREFEVSADEGGQSYAIVNMADKLKYRTESDANKKEGSGVPQHYIVSSTEPKAQGCNSSKI